MTTEAAFETPRPRHRIPLHRQVRDDLIRGIRGGAYHDQLPPESSLAHDLGVSRTTLRDALLELEREGVVVRRHGIGTFVVGSASTVAEHLDQLHSIPSLITASGFEPAVRSLSISRGVKSRAAAQALGRPESSRFTAISRTYLASGRPAAWVVDYVPSSRKLDEALAAFEGEMLPVLDAALGIRIKQVRATVTAVRAGRAVGRALGTSPSTPLVLLRHSVIDPLGRVCAYGESRLMPDIFTLTVVRVRE